MTPSRNTRSYTLRSVPSSPGRSFFFYIWNATFSVTSINSQIYMTMPKQGPKKLSKNTGTTFSVIMPPFTPRGGGGIITEMTVNQFIRQTSEAELKGWFLTFSLWCFLVWGIPSEIKLATHRLTKITFLGVGQDNTSWRTNGPVKSRFSCPDRVYGHLNRWPCHHTWYLSRAHRLGPWRKISHVEKFQISAHETCGES